ncbi:MAG: DUF732 domain-containing protein [Streptosporangiaceae bacterium]
MRRARPLAAAAVVLALAGCGGSAAASHHPASTRPAVAASPAPTVGPAGFISAVRRAGVGSKDLSDDHAAKVLLHVGRLICDGLDTDLSYADEISAVSTSLRSITVRQATVLVNAAIRGLCPNHADSLPAGS